jgi:hypothetical protein
MRREQGHQRITLNLDGIVDGNGQQNVADNAAVMPHRGR